MTSTRWRPSCTPAASSGTSAAAARSIRHAATRSWLRLTASWPTCRMRCPRSEAGLHLLLHMRNGMLEHELIERAKASGVRVYPLSAYYTPPVKPPRATLVLGYAGLTEQQIDEAAKLLKQAWS